ncbi:MAG: EscU/YscU/HrcU family type III secretion system export apparatus switch protein [Alphaproteobacteria bacterium]|jgi:flagellar biosynthesis protein
MTADNEKETPEKSRRAAAVALKKYGIEESALPKVVAAGYGKLAEQIVEIAFQNGVKVREDKDLAQMLAAIEIDSEIPSEALLAIAEVLAYVYKANGTYQSSKSDNKDTPPDDQYRDA